MDNMTPEFVEIYGNRRKTIERLTERNKKFAELTRVEFKRVILHIEGELVGFEKDELENLSARFPPIMKPLSPQAFMPLKYSQSIRA